MLFTSIEFLFFIGRKQRGRSVMFDYGLPSADGK